MVLFGVLRLLVALALIPVLGLFGALCCIVILTLLLILRLVGFLEKAFSIKIGKDDVVLENFVNVGAMKQLVLDKLAAGEGA